MDRNSTEQYSSNQIIVRDASAEDAQDIMHIWNSNISSTFNTFNSHIKTELEIKDTILETNKKAAATKIATANKTNRVKLAIKKYV